MVDFTSELWKQMHDQRGFLSFNQQNFLICTQIVPGLCFSVGPPDLYLFGGCSGGNKKDQATLVSGQVSITSGQQSKLGGVF